MVQFIWPNMSTRILPWTNRIHDIVLHQYIVPSQSLHYIHYKRSSLAGSLLIRNRSFMLLTTFGRGAAASFSLFTTISPVRGSQRLKPTSPSQLLSIPAEQDSLNNQHCHPWHLNVQVPLLYIYISLCKGTKWKTIITYHSFIHHFEWFTSVIHVQE